MVNPYRFYTYAYLREDKTPYYIGKGKGNRIYFKGRGEIKIPKDKSRIIFLKQNLTEEEAFKHEIYMIVVFGRKDLGTGILRNKTNGGDGMGGLVHTDETRKKMSESHKGENNYFYGKRHSQETIDKIIQANTGKTCPEEIKQKISSFHNKLLRLLSPSGEIVEEITTIRKFCEKYNLNRKEISKVIKGELHQFKGWSVPI